MYNFFFLLHVGAVVVGFGSSFVYPMLAVQARKLGPERAKESYAIGHASLLVSKQITTPVIWAAGLFGVLLVLVSADPKVVGKQTWVAIAVVLFLIAAALATFVHGPNLKAMDGLQAKLADGDVTPSPGGPPAEVVELQDRGKRAAMIGGILHLMWLLLMIDMIWKPGT